jgi:polyphosphate kinase 2 (PPK2 family)
LSTSPVRAGIAIVKVFLHISYSEQRRRLHARVEDPTKRWKFKEDDLKERALWPACQAAYEAALHRCSTAIAPWFVVPADSK